MFLSGAKIEWCDGLGVFRLNVEFSEQRLPDPLYATYQYDVTGEGDQSAVSAIFASAIRGNVGENKQEDEDELGFVVHSRALKQDVFNVASYYPFGLMTNNRANIVVVQDYKDGVVRKNELQSFSFLSAKNLPDAAKYVAGVVHPDGYPLNEHFMNDNVGFRVSKISKREFRTASDFLNVIIR